MRFLNIIFFVLSSAIILVKSIVNNNITKEQWKLIHKIIIHPNTPFVMRNKVNEILYSKYETWAIHKAYQFKTHHKYKCRNINIQDLILYSLEGLKKATCKYNGKSYFHKYAEIYISGQLYYGLTELQPITSIPKYIRKNKSHPLKQNHNNYNYKKMLNTQFVGYEKYWIFEKIQKQIDDIDETIIYELWNDIHLKLNPRSKQILSHKYNYFFETQLSNKKISEKMNCSEETIRQNLKKTNTFIQNSMIIINKKISSGRIYI